MCLQNHDPFPCTSETNSSSRLAPPSLHLACCLGLLPLQLCKGKPPMLKNPSLVDTKLTALHRHTKPPPTLESHCIAFSITSQFSLKIPPLYDFRRHFSRQCSTLIKLWLRRACKARCRPVITFRLQSSSKTFPSGCQFPSQQIQMPELVQYECAIKAVGGSVPVWFDASHGMLLRGFQLRSQFVKVTSEFGSHGFGVRELSFAL